MVINDLAMAVRENSSGKLAQGATAVRERASEHDGAGYAPESQGTDSADARGKIYISPPKSPSQNPHLPALISSSSDDNFLTPLFAPESFIPDPESSLLVNAEKNFFPKISDAASAARFAERLVVYFSRPLSGWYDRTFWDADGTERKERVPYEAPAPLLEEFANMHGMTKRELMDAALDFPGPLPRAVEFARNVLKSHLIRKGLTGDYDSRFTVFVATNETDMRVKSEHLERRVDVNDILDRIEREDKPITHDVV